MTNPARICTALLTALVASSLGGASPVLAAPGQKAGCPNINPELAISVAANESEFHKQEAKVILRGDVTIDQGVLHLAADEVTIEYLQGDTRDKGSQGQVNSLHALGTVKIECEGDRAHGGEAFYNVAQRTIKLSRDVLLVRRDNILKGDTLFIDLDTGNTTIEGGGTEVTGTPTAKSDTRIKAVFSPAAKDPNSDETTIKDAPATQIPDPE